MSRKTLRLSPRPGRERVGREPGMDECEVRFEERVVEIVEVFVDLDGGELALVDDGSGRQRTNVE